MDSALDAVHSSRSGHGSVSAVATPLAVEWPDGARRSAVAPARVAVPIGAPASRSRRALARSRQRELRSSAEFVASLQREKRRCERSARALSVVVYRFQGQGPLQPTAATRLLDTLRASIRETDVVGQLGDDAIAVLCTDTDERGLRGFLDKLAAKPFEALQFTQVAATYPDQLFDSIAGDARAPAETFDLLGDEGTPDSRRGYRLKPVLDFMVALAALLVAAPLMLLIAAAIALESPGPVIYRQQRLGIGGVPFVFYKFRSMWADVDDGIHRDFVLRLIRRGDGDKPVGTQPANPYKLRSDCRVSRVGRLIRKTSIDELPQLFNVLKGDMSLVGPRPPIPYEAASYQPWHLRRILAIKPGITGLWQVEGRSRVSFNEMVRMDLRYIRDCSLWLDLKILLKTVRVVLCCEGAR